MVRLRRLLVLAGAAAAVGLFVRRRRRERGRMIEIEDAARPEPPTSDDAPDDLESVEGIGPAYADRLREAGIDSVADLRDADAADLAEATEVEEGRVSGWIERAGEQAAN